MVRSASARGKAFSDMIDLMVLILIANASSSFDRYAISLEF